MNELGNVVPGGQANMNRMFRPGGSIIIFEPLSQCVSSDADDGIHLRIKRFRAPESLHRNAVFLDLVDCSFKVFFANKGKKPKEVIAPPEHTRRQDVVYFSPLRLKLADRRFHNSYPKNGPSAAYSVASGGV